MSVKGVIGRLGRAIGAETRLLVSFLTIAAAALVAGGAGLLSFERIESNFEQFAEQRVPALADALLMVEQAAAVNALTSTLAATTDDAEYKLAQQRAEVHRLKVRQTLDSLSAKGLDQATLASVETLYVDLFNALSDLEHLVGDRLEMAAERRSLVVETRKDHQALSTWLTPKIDDANFDLVIHTEDATANLGDQLEALMRAGVDRLNTLLRLRSYIDELTAVLVQASIADDREALRVQEDTFGTILESTKTITSKFGQTVLPEAIERDIASLAMLGIGDDSVFRKRDAILDRGATSPQTNDTTKPDTLLLTVERLRNGALGRLEPLITSARTDLIKLNESAVDGASLRINGLIEDSVIEVTSYLSIASESNWLAGLLRQAAAELDSAALGPLAEEIETAVLHLIDIKRALDLPEATENDLEQHLQPLFAQAIGDESLIARRRVELKLQEMLERAVTLTHDISLIFTNEINHLVDETRADVVAENTSVSSAITQGRWVLLALLATVLTITASIVLRERMYRQRLEASANELRRHHDHLQDLVEERTKTITDQAEELQHALDAEKKLTGLQRQFVSMVCHEFRTPLAIIDGTAQRLIRRQNKIPPEGQKDRLGKIRTAVIRLTDLMESVLSAARLEAGSITFEPAPCDLAGMIREVADNHMEVYPSHKIIVDTDQLPDSFFGDVKLLRQVISNLMSNAIKYSPEGERIWVLCSPN